MIELTKLNKKKFVLNCELIESVESTPDTVITLRNGKLYIVTEPPDEIVAKTVAFKQLLFSGLTTPISGMGVPISGRAAPKAGNPAPEIGEPTPETGEPAPETGGEEVKE